MRTRLPKEKWTPSSVKEFILACRRDEGIPMFKTKYGGIPFMIDHSNAVIAICWAGRDAVDSKVFTDVPGEDLKLLEEGYGDWRRILHKYGTAEEIAEAKRYGIYVGSWRLPKILPKGLVLKV